MFLLWNFSTSFVFLIWWQNGAILSSSLQVLHQPSDKIGITFCTASHKIFLILLSSVNILTLLFFLMMSAYGLLSLTVSYYLSGIWFLVLSLQAEFPANTNILYIDLPSAELIGSSNDETSLPGMVLNVKKPVTYIDQYGIKHWCVVTTFNFCIGRFNFICQIQLSVFV